MFFKIKMLGRFSLLREDNQPVEIESRKALELFCYLLLYRNRPHTREALAETIWGETSSSRSKKYIRQALWQIQSALGTPAAREIGPLILTDNEWVQINPDAKFCLDVADIETAYETVRDHHGKELQEEQFLKIKEATIQYQGDLLEGWFEDWCLFERERLQNIYLMMLDKCMGYCETHHAFEEALAFGENILRYDIARERTHRRMVRIYYMAGERTSAIRQYERCVATLQEELGVKPAKKTVELYERICEDHAHFLQPAFSQALTASSTPELITRLHHLEKMVDDFHRKVCEEIRTLEQSLKQA
ncbi:MAG TPA: BTAD domain-containing putative transcriptional regulator [Anaerolineales bacterium]|nr:BTAD domain-containing putative transcriptional regulator [Anaerolineales bacterium]